MSYMFYMVREMTCLLVSSDSGHGSLFPQNIVIFAEENRNQEERVRKSRDLVRPIEIIVIRNTNSFPEVPSALGHT